MQLQPRREPGRSDRKAAAYASEIVRLRAEGYTFEAIREALADVGIQLSESALRREVRRRRPERRASPGERPATPAPATPAVSSLPASVAVSSTATGSSGREIAKAFFDANPSNPLLRARKTP